MSIFKTSYSLHNYILYCADKCVCRFVISGLIKKMEVLKYAEFRR